MAFSDVSHIDQGSASVKKHYGLVDDFFPAAEAMRGAVEQHFADPARHTAQQHQIWNYWYVPGSYTYLRTAPEKVVGSDLAQQFYQWLQHYAFETFGLATTTWPYLSVYISGCNQALHNDSRGGRLGFAYSLTQWDDRKFSGGETLLFHEEPWQQDLTTAKATNGFYDLIPQRFNQLLVFDDRIPHGVQRIEGSMDPLAGRIVVHGHLSEGGIVVEGSLGVEELNPSIQHALSETWHRRQAAAPHYHGLLVLRLSIDAEGGQGQCSVLFDRVLPLAPNNPPFPSTDFVVLFSDLRFPSAAGPTRITIPIAIGMVLP
jgi:hypothetical protein